MGLVNAVYDARELEGDVARWVRRMNVNSPMDGAAGLAQIGGYLTRLFYRSQEGREGRATFKQARDDLHHKLDMHQRRMIRRKFHHQSIYWMLC